MGYYYNKIRNPKLYKIALKVSSVAALASFLTLFVGAANTKFVTVKDNLGFQKDLILTNDDNKNLQILKKDKDLNISDKDVVSFAQSEGESSCFIERCVNFNVEIDGQNLQVESSPNLTVEQAVKNVVNLGEFDEFSVLKSSKVQPNLVIKINRVVFKNRIEEVDVAYETKVEKDENLVKGDKRVVVKGENGKVRLEYIDKYINGELVSSDRLKKDVLKEPVTEIVKEGIRNRSDVSAEFSSAFSNKSTLLGKKRNRGEGGRVAAVSGELVGFATHYNKGRGTASGRPLQKGITVAADPAKIPYGAVVKVTDLKTGKVLVNNGVMADRCESAVKGKVVVDLYGVYVGKRLVKVEWHK